MIVIPFQSLLLADTSVLICNCSVGHWTCSRMEVASTMDAWQSRPEHSVKLYDAVLSVPQYQQLMDTPVTRPQNLELRRIDQQFRFPLALLVAMMRSFQVDDLMIVDGMEWRSYGYLDQLGAVDMPVEFPASIG